MPVSLARWVQQRRERHHQVVDGDDREGNDQPQGSWLANGDTVSIGVRWATREVFRRTSG
jgi:hypothetical protein